MSPAVLLTWALDLDGVVWLAGQAIPGSAEAVSELRSAGQRVVFLTNNSGPVVAAHLEALAHIGIECDRADLTTSAQAAAALLPAGTRAAVVGAAGIREALAAQAVKEVGPDESPDAVVVGRTVQLDYWALSAAASAIRGGARFVATNTDATFPVGSAVGPAENGQAKNGPAKNGPANKEPGDKEQANKEQEDKDYTGDGLLPGAGAIVAFLAAAAGRQPEVAGKPQEPMAALVRARYGDLDVVVGDRPDTDGLLAVRLGAKFGLVLSGVTRASDLPVKPAPDLVGADLQAVVKAALDGTAAK